MSDLIERQSAIDAIKKCRNESDMPDMWYDGMSCALRCIYQLPSAQPERKRGKWIKVNGKTAINCSACYHCSWSRSFEDTVKRFNFCPYCGADMREVDDERPD